CGAPRHARRRRRPRRGRSCRGGAGGGPSAARGRTRRDRGYQGEGPRTRVRGNPDHFFGRGPVSSGREIVVASQRGSPYPGLCVGELLPCGPAGERGCYLRGSGLGYVKARWHSAVGRGKRSSVGWCCTPRPYIFFALLAVGAHSLREGRAGCTVVVL
ncbi:unnamed protein product, partial [Ectocarpus sp. 8 AP-2014]